MSKQAKTLTQQEIRRVFDYVATRAHAERNRAMFATMLYAALRVKECASLRTALLLRCRQAKCLKLSCNVLTKLAICVLS